MKPIKWEAPYAVQKMTVSDGGANQITLVKITGDPPSDLVVTAHVESPMWITPTGDDGVAIDDSKAFPLLTGGFNEIPGSGFNKEFRIASTVQGAVARIMLARK